MKWQGGSVRQYRVGDAKPRKGEKHILPFPPRRNFRYPHTAYLQSCESYGICDINDTDSAHDSHHTNLIFLSVTLIFSPSTLL